MNNKKIITIATTGIALVALSGAVFADTTTTPTPNKMMKQHASHQPMGPLQNQELLTLLNIDSATLQSDLKAGQSLADIAITQGKTEQDVIDLLVGQATKRIDQGVEAGKIPQDKADQMKAKLSDGIKRMVEHKGELFKGHKQMHKGNEGQLKVIASVTGIDLSELKQKLKDGESIAQIAQEHNITEQDLINKLLDKDKERITKMVEKTWQGQDGSNKATN
ncbi:MAG TPA: hypothetical protein VJ824_05285 [Bacillota bacterium]|nr:hypothetical protein [Bacillota bacterium]